ncbi:hypothetical protein SNE25_24085 [Mucilaginibacter sabulilitoris]|uniref:DUF2780 domain-containing protein n=1 Tax=Mucilaginibacter sabulilitoris TaxID=1173583 RepID=A0ABZ0TML4_9SPHI|nr:hypothetical protein [Mucilaginibacter sabulilitoris]WPU92410.1 hypothetical protein SNE25_24085 [Mucilaginibacter sabulilitoris]
MKILLVALALSITTSAAFSQGILKKVQSAAASKNVSTSSLPSLSNISGVKDAIMAKLTPALGLTAVQKPAVSTDVTDYLKSKASIMPLANTDKTAYASKSSSLISGLSGKLKTALTVAQYSKFLGLKPSMPSAGNVLSSLFF